MEYTRDWGTPVPVMKVIVYYSGGSKLTVTTPEEWAELPDDNVQIVQVLYRKLYKRKYLQDVLAGENYYWYYADHYYGGNASQIPEEVQHIKTGSWVSDEQYLKLYNEALGGVMP